MTIEAILAQIDSEIARLQEARAFLSSSGGSSGAVATEAPVATNTATRKRGVMSAEARKRIADAQRKRWAAHKKAANASSKPAGK